MAARAPISRRRRYAIFKRDLFTCQYCGAKAPDVELQVDHILAVSNGGSNEDENLATACFDCNMGKLADFLPVSLEMAKTQEGVAPEWVDMVGSVIAGEAFILASKLAAIRRFLLELGLERTVAAAEIASDKFGTTDRGFRYFHGICTKWISLWGKNAPQDHPRDSQKNQQDPTGQ